MNSSVSQRHKQGRSLRLNLRTVRSMVAGVLIGGAVFAALAITMILSLYGYFQLSDRILPGVTVGGVGLGNSTTDEAADLIGNEWAQRESIVVEAEGSVWAATPAELGLSVDAAATAQRALSVGRGDRIPAEVGTLLRAAFIGIRVEPVVVLDPQEARATLEGWAERVYVPPRNATLTFEAGDVIPVAGLPGQRLDVDSSLMLLEAQYGPLVQEGRLPLILVDVPPAIPDASAVAADAEALIGSDLTLRAVDPILNGQEQWTIDREEMAGWLLVEEGESELRVSISGGAVQESLAARAAELGAGQTFDAEQGVEQVLDALRVGREVTALTIVHTPTTYTIQPGDTLISIAWQVGMPYWRILEANSGLDADNLIVGQQLTIPSKNDLLPLPVVAGKRITVDISEQRLRTYEDGELLNEYVISTGISDSPTQPGVFQVQTHDPNAYASVWDLHMPHFIGIYEAWPGFMNGFHGLPTRNGGRLMWADALGRPTSYGCIILDLPAAEWLYTWAEAGVVVEITE